MSKSDFSAGEIIHVETGRPYDVLIRRRLLYRCGAIVRDVLPKAERALIIVDSNVAPLYADTVRRSLEAAEYAVSVHVFPAGEEHKRLDEIAKMYEAMVEAGLTRSDFAVALGGGVTGDMCGFAAATYLRGIPFVQIPTTVLAQNDSSVGGKTGVDLAVGKNLVGSFHQPCLVLADADTLQTLPQHYITDGFGEIIKHGCIKSAPLFHLLTLYGVNMSLIEEYTARSIAIKADVVARDEKEAGERMLLNFGHTLGHAIEKCGNFTDISHGEAVGVGMLLMARAGEAAGLTKPGTSAALQALLAQCGMPTSCDYSLEDVCEAAMKDKKRRGDTMNIVLLREIGDAFVYQLPCHELFAFVHKGVRR